MFKYKDQNVSINYKIGIEYVYLKDDIDKMCEMCEYNIPDDEDSTSDEEDSDASL